MMNDLLNRDFLGIHATENRKEIRRLKRLQRQADIDKDSANAQLTSQLGQYLSASASNTGDNNMFMYIIVGGALLVAIIIAVIFKN